MTTIRFLFVAAILSLFAACSSDSGVEDEMTASADATAGLSVQLWSVRDLIADDFEGTLTEIAALGFDAVELAGEFGPYDDDAEGLKAFLDGLGLEVSSAHVSFEMLSPTSIAETTQFYATLGTSTLIIPWDERGWDADRVDELVADLRTASAALQAYGMRVGYHNHDREFDAFGKATFWDYIASQTGEDIVLQLDIGWVVYAGFDPVDFIERNAGRIISAHYKISPRPDAPESPILGDDDLDWAALTQTAVTTGGLQWMIIEQETYPEGLSSLASVAASKAGLARVMQ